MIHTIRRLGSPLGSFCVGIVVHLGVIVRWTRLGRLISENDVNISEGGKGESEISNTNLANSLSSEASASVLSKIVDFFAGMFR